MSTRSVLACLALVASFGCKHQEQGPAEAAKHAEEAPPADTSVPAAGPAHDTWSTTPPPAAATTPAPGTGQAPGAQPEQKPTTEIPMVMRLVEIQCTQMSPKHHGWRLDALPGATCQEMGQALIISAGDEFALVIREGHSDMTARRKAVQADASHKFRRFALDTTDAVIYETESPSGKAEYGVFVRQKVGNVTVTCEGQKEHGYSLQQAEALVKACQSLTKK